MDEAKAFSHRSSLQNSSFFVTARSQTHGRGRLGRIWMQSNSNDFLPLTLALARQELAIPLEWVSLMAGVAVYDALLAIYKYVIKTFNLGKLIANDRWALVLKWPNDLVWYTDQIVEKLSGILCEAQVQTNAQNFSHIYIGIGLNLFDHPRLDGVCAFFDKIISESNAHTLTEQERSDILSKMHTCLEKNLRQYLCCPYSLKQMQKMFIKRSFPIGTSLSVNQNKHIGTFYGVNKDGALLLQSSLTKIEKIYSSENLNLMTPQRNIVCIDFGNTRIHLKAQNSQAHIYHDHIAYTDLKSEKSVQFFEKIIKMFDVSKLKNIEVFYVSVNSKAVTKQSIAIIKHKLKKLRSNIKIILKQMTEKDIFKYFVIPKTFDHKTLGADRALKCVFAYERAKNIGKNVLVVSFGTATTCEGFSKDGIMVENFVFPGMQMSLDALHHFTALLPKISARQLKFCDKQKYWTQNVYLKRGVLLNAVSTIFVTAKLHQPCHVILTGGNVDIIKDTLVHIASNEILDTSNIEIIENIETSVLMDFAHKIQ